jgi:hypothetical protein
MPAFNEIGAVAAGFNTASVTDSIKSALTTAMNTIGPTSLLPSEVNTA